MAKRIRLIPGPGQVVVLPVEQADTTAGGVFLPQQSRKLLDEGVIKEIGAGIPDLKVDDRIIYGRYAGTTVKLSAQGAGAYASDAVDVIIMDRDEIKAVIEVTEVDDDQ